MVRSKSDRLDRCQVEKAARALIAFCNKKEDNKKDLLNDEGSDRIYLMISLKQVCRKSRPNPKLL